MNVEAVRQTGLVPEAILHRVEHGLQEGGSVLTQLARQPELDLPALWQALASRAERHFIPSPAAAGPIDARLFGQDVAVDYLILPRVRVFNTIRVISPNPLRRVRELDEVRGVCAAWVPSRQVTFQIDITTPAVFRELFALTYPAAPSHYRSSEDAAALAALIPRLAWGVDQRPTPEELTQAIAAFAGLPYVDTSLQAPDRRLWNELPAGPFLQRRLVPYVRQADGRFGVLGAVERSEDVAAVQVNVARLMETLHVPLVLALTSRRALNILLSTYQKETNPE